MAMTQKPRKAGTRIAQGAPVDDPRILSDKLAAESGLDVFKWTQLQAPYIKRSDVERASYNPRSMDASGKKKLREGLKRYGLVERPVFNCQTGVLVGGHQRLEQMDKLMGYGKDCDDYLLPVNAIAISDTQERELNVLLNNDAVQGSYDIGALEDLFANDTNPFNAGFDTLDLGLMFGGDFVSEMKERFGDWDDTETQDARADGVGDAEMLQAEADKIAALKARKKEQIAEDRERNDADHILHIVFDNRKALMDYLGGLGMDVYERYVHASRFIENTANIEEDNELWGDE